MKIFDKLNEQNNDYAPKKLFDLFCEEKTKKQTIIENYNKLNELDRKRIQQQNENDRLIVMTLKI